MPRRHRVFVSGIGLNTPLAATREESWQRLINGDRGIDWLDSDDEKYLPLTAGAPAVRHQDLAQKLTDWKQARLIPLLQEPANALAMGAALEAVEHSGITWSQLNPTRVGCVIGTSKGGVASIHSWAQAENAGEGSTDPNPVDWNLLAANAPALGVASLLNCQAACLSPVTACATGMSCLLRAVMLIQSGECDVVVAGSSDASLTPSVVASFRRLGVLAQGFSVREECDQSSNEISDSEPSLVPSRAVTPFDKDRTGFLIGEGAGIFVLESEAHLRKRNGSPIGEWLSAGTVSDAAGLTQLESDPQALTWLIKDVVRRCGKSRGVSGASQSVAPDYISLHGTATKINDRCEAIAVRESLVDQASDPCCSSIKGAIGHLLGAAGSVEFGFTCLALRDQIAPPNVNLNIVDDECRLNFVSDVGRPHRIRTALKLSLGFGGHLVAAMIGRPS
jgi:3-oxoacyl-[acyl-carrier-protein] synthase II